MNKLNIHKHIFFFVFTFLCTSCSYIQHYQQHVELSRIQTNIPLSKLEKVNAYTSHAPFHKTYEFEFSDTQGNSPYALIFFISESRFNHSMIKHRYQSDLHRDAIRIDSNKKILVTLNKNLPDVDTIRWQLVAEYIPQDEARDGYHILQEYIRHKIRDL